MNMLFAGALGAISALIVTLLISIVWPQHRIWPPKENSRWSFALVWLLTVLALGALLLLGVLDWNGLHWPGYSHLIAGGVLMAVGNILAWASVRQLGMLATSGGKGGFVTSGLYRASRNPQYGADILILIGWMVMSASAFVFPVALLAIAAFLLTPFAEEPWLEERFGDDYTAYMRQTPRFLIF